MVERILSGQVVYECFRFSFFLQQQQQQRVLSMRARLYCAVLFNALVHENKHVYNKPSGISAVTLVIHHHRSFRAENGTALKTESINTLSPNHKPYREALG